MLYHLFGDHGTKEAVMSEESIMEDFFGRVDKGRELVSGGYPDYWWECYSNGTEGSSWIN